MNHVIHQISHLMRFYPVKEHKEKIRTIKAAPDMVYPCGFFNSDATDSRGAARVQIVISSSHTINFKLGCGASTNTRAELLALWVLLYVVDRMGLLYLHVFGDSSVIIN